MVATNLRLCTVKLLSPPDIDRRFCFQVVSPARSYILQGLSDDDVNQWVTILQAAIGAALNSGASDANDDSSAEIGLSRDKKVRRPAARRAPRRAPCHRTLESKRASATARTPGTSVQGHDRRPGPAACGTAQRAAADRQDGRRSLSVGDHRCCRSCDAIHTCEHRLQPAVGPWRSCGR